MSQKSCTFAVGFSAQRHKRRTGCSRNSVRQIEGPDGMRGADRKAKNNYNNLIISYENKY